ncbi:MAG: DUF3604 domain-containing protein [Parachlamydiales bacterium]|jgi:hypothetical protein
MRRSICYCEPTHAYAGEVNTWKFIYTTGSTLPKGTKLRFDMMSKGRNIDWETPTHNLKEGNNVIYGVMENGKILSPKLIDSPSSIVPQFEFVLPSEIPSEHSFTIVIGSPKLDGPSARKSGSRAQTLAQRRRTFGLFVDPTGKGHFDEPELFALDVRGDKLDIIRIIVPSFVSKNKRFDAVVRFEDQYSNLTSNAPDETLIELTYEHIRENLNWRLFVPETGFLALPNMYFNEQGVFTIKLHNNATKEVFKAPPIKCFNETENALYWGLFHGESERFDSTESIESCLRHFRDEHVLGFYGVSPFENAEETPNEVWKQISQNVSDFDEADRFTTFLGFQWQGAAGSEGLRQIVFAKEGKTLPRKKEGKYPNLSKLYKSYSPKEIIAIPTFTMGDGYHYNFKEYDPDYERVAEIYNAWGSSECTEKEGNAIPITIEGKKGVKPNPEGSLQKALLRNCRFGFVSGGLDDRGVYGHFYDSDQKQYSPGLTAVICKEHTRQAIFDALWNRHCYATSGPRIIVGISIAGATMGSEITTADKPGLRVNRHIAAYAVGTEKLSKVEIIRNGVVVHTVKPTDYHVDFTYDDMDPWNKLLIDAKDKKPSFVYYYLRVTQEDGNMAWSSPIWIDEEPTLPGKGRRLIKASTKAAPAIVKIKPEEDEVEEFDDVEEDEDLE